MNRALPALLLAALAVSLPARSLLEIRGDYLIYSYDHNYIFAQGGVQLKSAAWTVRAGALEVDMETRQAVAGRGCRVEAGGREYEADVLEIDLDSLSLKLISYQENIRTWTLPAGAARDKGVADVAAQPPPNAAADKPLVRRDLDELRRSLVYFLNQRIVVTDRFRLYGYQCTVFLEGAQSLSFKKFKLEPGGKETSKLQGVWIDRLWYYASQGIVASTHFLVERGLPAGKARLESSLDVKYDPFGQVEYGPALRVDFNSRNSFNLTRRHQLDLHVGFLTDNLLRGGMALTSQWTPWWRSVVAIEYSRTKARREELWLYFRSVLQDKHLGDMALNLGYEREGQYQGDISLRNQAVKNMRLALRHSFSRLLLGAETYNRQNQSGAELSYTHRLFQMVADYSFHRDLLQDLTQGTPRFTLNATPFRLYRGLLRVDFASSFMVNQLQVGSRRDDQSRANLALNLQSEPIAVGPGSTLTMALSSEQLLEQDRENRFTSLGCVLKYTRELGARAELDFLYNFNARRRSEDWLIQGTTSQDWSAVLRLKDNGQRLKGWASLSYDTKTGRVTSSYLDCAVSLVKNWHFQTQMNYDFLFKNFSCDLYLIRHAGRIMLRASYRSLSRRLLLEILPR